MTSVQSVIAREEAIHDRCQRVIDRHFRVEQQRDGERDNHRPRSGKYSLSA